MMSINYGKLNAINIAAFKVHITNSDLIKNPNASAAELAKQYDSILSTLIDLHVPPGYQQDIPKPCMGGPIHFSL